MTEIIDGKLVSKKVREEIAEETKKFKAEYSITPGLAVILVGNNPASAVYVRNKHKASLEVGFESFQIMMPEDTTEEELLDKIDELNNDNTVHGILVQLPLPKHISEEKVINKISPKKDVDAFHPVNVGKIVTGNFDFIPCTPAGIIELLHHYNVEISGKDCLVIGRSNIVGKPMSLLLLKENGTVTIAHSRTKELKELSKRADIIVVAIGKPKFLTKDMVKPGAVVIDVGINRMEDGTLCGDVDFGPVSEVCDKITPVPGGVGPMTITMLLKNTLTAAKKMVLDR